MDFGQRQEHHIVNFLNLIRMESVKDNFSFSLNVPAKAVDAQKLQDPISQIDELCLDEIVDPNSLVFKNSTYLTCSEMYGTIFLKGKIDGSSIKDKQIEVPQEFEEMINEKKKKVEARRKQHQNRVQMKIEEGLDPDQEDDVKTKLKFYNRDLNDLNEFIGKNEEIFFRMAYKNFVSQKKKDQKYFCDFLPVEIKPSIYKDFFIADYNGNYNAPGFKKVQYSSVQNTANNSSKTQEIDAKLADILKGFGLGKFQKNSLQRPLDEAFDFLEIKAEYQKIDFQREWINHEVFQLKKLELQNEKAFSWSNGSLLNQNEDAKFPYVIEGAIIIRNIQISGMKMGCKNLLQELQKDPKDNNILFFKLDDDFEISPDYKTAFLKKPRILGYILKPVQKFPLFSQKNFQNNEDSSEEFFSATDNFTSINEIKHFKRNQYIIGDDQHYKVLFINKHDYKNKFFENFENLYRDCIQEWTNNLRVKISIVKDQEEINYMNDTPIHVVLDKSGQTFTKGFGDKLEIAYELNEYNQKFGFKDFHKLISSRNPDISVIQKCKSIVLHEIGRILGLFREQMNPSFKFNLNPENVIDFYKKNIVHINKEQNQRQSEIEIQKNATERANNNIFYNQDFSNYDKIDTSSVMFLEYPKIWLQESINQESKINYTLSKNDIDNVFKLLKDDNPLPEPIKPIMPPQQDLIYEQKEEILSLLKDKFQKEEIIEFFDDHPKIILIPDWKKKLSEFISEIQNEQKKQQKEILKNKKEEIVILLKDNYNKEQIIQSFEEDQEIIQIQDWKQILSDLISEIIDEQSKIQNEYFQKKKEEILLLLKENFLKEEIIESFDDFPQIIQISDLKQKLSEFISEIQNELQKEQKEILKNKKEEIVILLKDNFNKEQIIQSFEKDQEIIQIQDWKQILSDLISEIIDEMKLKPVCIFKDYQQKKNFITKIQNKDQFINNLKILSDGPFKLSFKDLTKQQANEYFQFYEQNKILSVIMEQVFDEEKKECINLIASSHGNIDLQKISQQTLLHIDIVSILHQDFINKSKQLEEQKIREEEERKQEEEKIRLANLKKQEEEYLKQKEREMKQQEEERIKKEEEKKRKEDEQKRKKDEKIRKEFERQQKIQQKKEEAEKKKQQAELQRQEEEDKKKKDDLIILQQQIENQQKEFKNEQLRLMKQTVEQMFKFKSSKQQIEDACKSYKVDEFEETLQQFYDEALRKQNEFQKLPGFDNYLQKKNLIQKLNEGQIDTNLEDNVIKHVFNGLTKQNLQILYDFFRQNHFITYCTEDILEDEMKEVQQIIQQQIDLQKLDFDHLQKKLLIKKEIIQEIFDQEIQIKCENFIDEEDQMVSIFNQSLNMKMSKIEILRKIIIKDPDLKSQMIDIFRESFEDYKSLRQIMNQNKLGEYLFENEIEEFLSYIQKNQHKKAISLVEKFYNSDPILALKLYYYLNNEHDGSSDQQFKTMMIILDKDYEIIKTYNNKNALRVIQKAVLATKDCQNNDNYQFQKNYEDRQLFYNSDPDLVRDFLQEYKKIDKLDAQIVYSFQNLIEKYKSLNIQISDYNFIEHYQLELEGFEILNEQLQKNPNDSDITKEDLKQVSKHFQRCIVIHQQDMKNYKTFGRAFQQRQHIHIQHDNMNDIYQIVKPIDLKIKHEAVNADQFVQKYADLFNQLQAWMRHFFGFKYLFQYIYDEESGLYKKQHIEILDDLAKTYKKYEQDPSDENFKLTLQTAITLKNSGKEIFNEWHEYIMHNSKTGKSFKDKFDFYQAREESEILIQMLDQIKQKFPDPIQIFKLEDFNRLSSRVDINRQTQRFKETQANPEKFVQNIFQQMFGFINRRENISQLVAILKSLKLPVEVSARFLLNLVLQNCDIDLRTRILYYQSEYFSLPLIMNCQTSFKSEKYILHYVPEVVFSMLEGMGIFNFAAGKRCIHPTGKSMLINDLLFPTQEFQHEAFEQQDKNLFSSGQVDVFFEKSFDLKRNFVMIDGQGFLKLEAIQNTLILTNIAMIHIHHKDLQEEFIVEDLKNKIQLIRQSETQNNKITIVLIVRDASDTNVLKTSESQDKVSSVYRLLQSLEDEIDYAVQLINLNIKQKMERIEEIKPLLQIFYSLIEKYNTQKSNFKFTKKIFSEKFIMQDQSQKSNSKLIQDIINKSIQFTEKVVNIQQNIFSENALPVLDIKNKIRQKIIQLRNTIQNDNQIQQQVEAELEKSVEDLREKLRQTKPSQIMEMFKQLVEDPNSSIIFQDIARNLREITFENTQEPKQKKQQLVKDHTKENEQNINQSKEEIDKRILKLQKQLDQLDNEIYEKSVSLEYFQRCLVYYLEKDCDFKDWNQGSSKNKIIDCIERQIKNGDCFELIDGENLEFKGLLIQEIVKVSKNDKVIVVCVIGPQSSGKSTLLNFAFGTQFFTSTGRCTKGIYFTLQKFPDDFKSGSGVKWMIMLDTEGLQSPERIDDEYDRKIVLFAMLSSDVLIINNKGEITATMINTLKVCCVTYDDLQQFGNRPEIIYTYGQNTDKNKEFLKGQVESLKQSVISSKIKQSKTIQKTAEDLLGYKDDKLNVFGIAYKSETIQKDDNKGIKQDIHFKINVTQFGVESSYLLEIVQKHVKEKNSFRDIQMWLSSSKQNWDLIDRYSSKIIQFQNLKEMTIDRDVMEFFNNQWTRYIQDQNVEQNDQLESDKKSQELINIFKKQDEHFMEQEQEKIFLENSKLKDAELEKYVFNPYEKWKMLEDQKDINMGSEKRYKSEIHLRNEVLKDQFNMMLKNKVQELKMSIINKNGLKDVTIRAQEIKRSDELKNIAQKDQNKYLENEFQKAFAKAIQCLNGDLQLQKMKKNYFNSLVKQFGIQNPYILNIGEEEYNFIDYKINDELQMSQEKDSRGIFNFLLNKLTQPDKGYKNDQFIQNLFKFNNDIVWQIPDDPKERIFDETKKETFLQLKSIFRCDYTYKISSNLGKDLDRDQLYETLMQKLTITKLKKRDFKKYNYYGKQYIETQQIQVFDEKAQKSQIFYIFDCLKDAGFYYQNNKNQQFELSQLIIDEIFQDFCQGYQKSNHYSINQMNIELQNRKYWADQISRNIQFDQSQFQQLNQNIQFLFQSQIVEIKDRDSPLEKKEFHLNLDQKLKNALYISNPKITYKKSVQAKSIGDRNFQAIVSPQKLENHQLQKWSKLSEIAFRQIQWEKIIQHIISSVRSEMNLDQISGSADKSFMKSKYLGTELREILNEELNQKMCLYIGKDLDAKISWCAIIVCWVELYKKAENSFNKQKKYLESQKDDLRKQFFKIIEGKTDGITNQNSKLLIDDCIQSYISKMINLSVKDLIDNQFPQKKVEFDTLKVYQELDKYYLESNLGAQHKVNNFLMYVQQPEKIFQQEVEKKSQTFIVPLLENKSLQTQQVIQESILILSQLINIIYQQSMKINNWATISIENYFDVKVQNKLLNNQEVTQLTTFFSPIIYNVFQRIILGSFDMKEFSIQIQIKDQKQKQKTDLQITPKQRDEGGPLHIFTDQQFRDSITKFHQANKGKPSYELINILLQLLNSYQQSDRYEIFELNIVINLFQDLIKKKLDQFNKKQFDEIILKCQDSIKGIKQIAIGCTQRCKFCNRKCELQQHSTQKGIKHSCKNVGHQMRVFAGGYFLNEDKQKLPSTFTCDIIGDHTDILINDNKFNWKEIKDTQLKDWEIEQEKQGPALDLKQNKFNKFWGMEGEDFCKKNGFIWKKKIDNIDEDKQILKSNVLVIALDGSGSMSGHPWDSVVIGAKTLINYAKTYHQNPRQVQLIVIIFNTEAQEVYNNTLDEQIGEIWNFPSGGTNFNPAFDLGMSKIQSYILKKDKGELHFFTDGEDSYPQEAVANIQNQLTSQKDKWIDQQKKLKLKFNIYCSNQSNLTMQQVNKNLNQFSNQQFGKDLSKLQQDVDVAQLGELMIENFRFNN